MRWQLGVLAAAALCTACGPKLVREEIFRNETVLVEARHVVEGGEPVPRGYAHPVTIADVRLAHILASITHEDSKGRRGPSIRSAHVYDLAEGIAKALSSADPDSEVLGATFSRDRRLGIFTDDHVTVLGAHLDGDLLILNFYDIEQPLDKERSKLGSGEWKSPSELPANEPSFRLIPGEGQQRRGARGLAVDWRDPYYRNPVSLRYRFGQVRRRTIIMEQEGEESPLPPPEPGELSDAQLRALDELEAARYSGYVTEGEYQRRRRLVLEGRVDEAGYGSSPDE